MSGAVRGALTIGGTRGLLPLGVKDSAVTTHTENIESFEEQLVSECTVQMLASWVVADRHLPRNIAHAHLSRSWQGSSHFRWTTTVCIVCSAEAARTVGCDLPVYKPS